LRSAADATNARIPHRQKEIGGSKKASIGFLLLPFISFLFPFISFYFHESGLFKGLRAKETKNLSSPSDSRRGLCGTCQTATASPIQPRLAAKRGLMILVMRIIYR
jgi:hypothetical protein